MIPPSCVVQMSDCVQASQCRPLGRAQPGEAHWQHGENSCAQVLSSAAHSSDVGQTDTALCLHMVVVYVLCLFTCFLCTRCFLMVSRDGHCSAWSSFFEVFSIWQLMALLRCCGCTPQWAFLRDSYILGLLLGKTAPDVWAWFSCTWDLLPLNIIQHVCSFVFQSISFFLMHSVFQPYMPTMVKSN